MERELVDMFMGTLQGHYYDRMVGLKMGKIQSPTTGNSAGGVCKKLFSGYPKKKEVNQVLLIFREAEVGHNINHNINNTTNINNIIKINIRVNNNR